MKFFIAILLTALLAYTAYLFDSIIPWWGFAIGALIIGWVVPQKSGLSWLAGFVGLLLCWAILAWYMDKGNRSLLSAKMAEVFGLQPSSTIMIFISSFFGALVAGFAALTGSYIRNKPRQSAE